MTAALRNYELAWLVIGVILTALPASATTPSPPPPTPAPPPVRLDTPPAHLAHPAPPPGTVTPGDQAPADHVTAQTMATALKPKGFRYSILRQAIVQELSGHILYLLPRRGSKHTRAVPVPRDRKLLATCLEGGKVEDLVRGAIVTARYDPRGVIRPRLKFEKKSAVELLEGAKVLDRGGNKLYVITAQGRRRGFGIEGGAKAWEAVVNNGPAAGLVPGAKIRLRYDPSGREPLDITLLEPEKVPKPRSKGCGCDVHGPRGGGLDGGPLALLVAILGGWWGLRRRDGAGST